MTSTASALEYVVHAPPEPADALIVWLHGLGADGHDFAGIVPMLGLPSDHRVRFVFPHAPIRPITINGGMEMRGWYDIADQSLNQIPDAGGIAQSVELVTDLLERELAAGIEGRRAIVAGFSQGGAIATLIGAGRADPLAGVMALSTYMPLPEQVEQAAAAHSARPPFFIGHGSGDPMVPERLGIAAAKTLERLGFPLELHSYRMPHAVNEEEIRDIGAWIRTRLQLTA